MWKGLTQAQREQLIAGKELVLDEDVPGKPWPRFTVYRLVQSPPKTVAAVFWNAELDPAYIPNCTAVSILASPKPSTQDVEYTLKMPFVLPDEIYLSRNELRNPSPETYEVNWKVLRSRYTSSCIGNLRIEPHGGEGEQSLIRYTNLVEPASKFAVLLRSRAGVQLIESVGALVHQVDKESKRSPELLERQLAKLEAALDRSSPESKP